MDLAPGDGSVLPRTLLSPNVLPVSRGVARRAPCPARGVTREPVGCSGGLGRRRSTAASDRGPCPAHQTPPVGRESKSRSNPHRRDLRNKPLVRYAPIDGLHEPSVFPEWAPDSQSGGHQEVPNSSQLSCGRDHEAYLVPLLVRLPVALPPFVAQSPDVPAVQEKPCEFRRVRTWRALVHAHLPSSRLCLTLSISRRRSRSAAWAG